MKGEKKKKKKWNVEGRRCIRPKHSHLCIDVWGCELHTCEGNESILQPSSHLDSQTGAQPRQLNYYINTGQPMWGDKQTVTGPQLFLLTPVIIKMYKIKDYLKRIFLVPKYKLGSVDSISVIIHHHYHFGPTFWEDLNQKCEAYINCIRKLKLY